MTENTEWKRKIFAVGISAIWRGYDTRIGPRGGEVEYSSWSGRGSRGWLSWVVNTGSVW